MNRPCINLLVVEDNPGDARLVRETLRGAADPAYQVECVDHLGAGLARLAEGGVDVLLLDLGLPDSQGLGALGLVRALRPALPVVVLSGAADEQFAVEAVQAGAQDYLVKGRVDRHLLKRSIRYAIERKRADEALRVSEERLRLAMTAANEAIWEYDPVSGAVRWNETYARNFGRPAATGASQQWWMERIHPEDADRVITSQTHAVSGADEFWSADYRMMRADGEWAEVQDRAVIARDGSGKATRIVGAMLDVSGLKRAEEALLSTNRRLHELSSHLLRAQDSERRRIARELHDSTAQLLAALSINLSRLQEPSLEPERRRRVLAEAGELAAACSMEIRTVTYLLHPPLLQEIGLAGGLEAYIQGYNQRTGIEVEVKIQPDFGRVGCDLEGVLFRVVQEGLANVHKHSRSRVASIRLERDPQEVRLTVQDRGRGLPADLNPQAPGFARFGVGIMGMRERVEQLGGELELVSNGAGAKLTVRVPFHSIP